MNTDISKNFVIKATATTTMIIIGVSKQSAIIHKTNKCLEKRQNYVSLYLRERTRHKSRQRQKKMIMKGG